MLRGSLCAVVEGALCLSGSGSNACWRNSGTAEPALRVPSVMWPSSWTLCTAGVTGCRLLLGRCCATLPGRLHCWANSAMHSMSPGSQLQCA